MFEVIWLKLLRALLAHLHNCCFILTIVALYCCCYVCFCSVLSCLLLCSLPHNPHCCLLSSPMCMPHLYIPQLFTHCLPTIICVKCNWLNFCVLVIHVVQFNMSWHFIHVCHDTLSSVIFNLGYIACFSNFLVCIWWYITLILLTGSMCHCCPFIFCFLQTVSMLLGWLWLSGNWNSLGWLSGNWNILSVVYYFSLSLFYCFHIIKFSVSHAHRWAKWQWRLCSRRPCSNYDIMAL